MLKNINIHSFVKEKEMSILFKKLYPICSSITGKGFTDRLKIINAVVHKGRVLKRFIPRAMGRATPKNDVLTHVELVAQEM